MHRRGRSENLRSFREDMVLASALPLDRSPVDQQTTNPLEREPRAEWPRVKKEGQNLLAWVKRKKETQAESY